MKIVKDGKSVNIGKNAYVQHKVLEALSKEEILSTPELEEITGFQCYGACKSLEEKGFLNSSLKSDYTLWDPISNQVVTEENYDAIVKGIEEARESLRKKLEDENLSEDEIQEKIQELTNFRSLEYKVRQWMLNETVEINSQKNNVKNT